MKEHIRHAHKLEGDQLTAAIQFRDNSNTGNVASGNRMPGSLQTIASNRNRPYNVTRNVRNTSTSTHNNGSSLRSSENTRPMRASIKSLQEEIVEAANGILPSSELTVNNGMGNRVNNELQPIRNTPMPNRKPINTPEIAIVPVHSNIKTEQNTAVIQEVRDLNPLLNQFPSSAPQPNVLEMEPALPIGNPVMSDPMIEPVAQFPMNQQFNFDEDVRQIAHHISRVANSQPHSQDALRRTLFETILTFESGGFNNDPEEFFRKMGAKYPKN